ncbi:type IV secretion system protein [Vreelandella stevensii]|uniref:type IV secretion system protein n=1 Tax=Vreelandella stevensii TaxID=502821 RepID=UPI0003691DC0|nr:type IV secretion system protein [Halomonas stevensii]
MITTNLFQRAFERIDNALNDYIITSATQVIDFIAPIFTSLMIIWIAIWGYLMMFGRVGEPLQEGVFRILRIGFILTLGLTVGTYADVVVGVLSNGPETLASVVTGAPPGSVATSLDTLFSKIFEVSEAAWNRAGVMNGNFGLYIIGAAILIAGGMLTVVVAFLILLSKIMTAVLLVLGPLFISMLLFNATQRWFESWLGMVVNYGLILVIGAAVGQLMVELGGYYIDSMSNGDSATMANLGDAAMLCIIYALCILVVKQVPSVASALGGGLALATQGAIGSAMNAMRPSTVRRQYMGMRRDARFAGRAMASPYKAGKAAHAAYQRRFGTGNTIMGG